MPAEATTFLGLRPTSWITLAVAALLAWGGWLLTWHLADDAFITYRYLSNAMLGRGLVWNPEPFHAADGNTDFLWSLLLLFVWKVFGAQPPAVANTLALGFGVATLWLVARAVERLPLPERLRRARPVLLALVLATIVSNRAFLASLSSGIGQAFFNAALIAWTLAVARRGRSEQRGHWFAVAGLAAWCGVSRPEGHLVVAATLLLLGLWSFGIDRRRGALAMLVAVLPVAAHLVFRRATYGTWLPCTYYAKSVAAWPDAGVRYLTTFVVEFGLYVVVAIAVLWLLTMLRRGHALAPLRRDNLGVSAAAGVFVVHFVYYTFKIGGDLFEWRPYTHLVIVAPLLLVVMLRDLWPRPGVVVGVAALALVVAQPIPWVKFCHDDGPVGPQLPAFARPLVAAYDRDQAWLNEHILCMRNFHMKDNYRVLEQRWPTREVGERIPYDGYPTFAAGAVGLVAWVFPNVAMIDIHGLNDWVVANTPVLTEEQRRAAKLGKKAQLFAFFDQDKDGAIVVDELRAWRAALSPETPADELERIVKAELAVDDADGDGRVSKDEYVKVDDAEVARRHAHERSPPPGYVDGFRVNVFVENRVPRVEPREPAMTADDIRAHEQRFREMLGERQGG